MLQLSRHDRLAMQVRDLLDLQGTLKRSRELASTSQKQQGVLSLESARAQLLDRLVQLEDLLNLRADLAKTLHDLFAAGGLGGAVLAEGEGDHDHGDELGGVRLGRCNTDLRAGVDVDTAVGEEGDGGSDDVDDTHGEGAALEAVAQSHQGVGRLAGLGSEDAGVVAEDGGLAIQEVGGELDRKSVV